jgi:hypothetical protein
LNVLEVIDVMLARRPYLEGSAAVVEQAREERATKERLARADRGRLERMTSRLRQLAILHPQRQRRWADRHAATNQGTTPDGSAGLQ